MKALAAVLLSLCSVSCAFIPQAAPPGSTYQGVTAKAPIAIPVWPGHPSLPRLRRKPAGGDYYDE
jgi:hypothetical protein